MTFRFSSFVACEVDVMIEIQEMYAVILVFLLNLGTMRPKISNQSRKGSGGRWCSSHHDTRRNCVFATHASKASNIMRMM